ncbi:hypothetical protein GHK92_00865 [Nocardioides sp. dk4132]|uniref:LppM family (lipo)protein n=1 Tax=unclassified Nocardioides TaxID=2615069 RepID=UPI0012951635|nr:MULTISPECIES: hypothetical protein [unclassified Nocardioides]MQW74417.1 hypothetical protein [Nocardioides sp. dk4132]QGA06356.1 hypothetical protein GFH29_02310 [Nocardioides sp. dk884]
MHRSGPDGPGRTRPRACRREPRRELRSRTEEGNHLHRLLPATAVAATALLTLTGCFRIDLDLVVDPDDVVSGTIVTAVDTEALEELRTMFADLKDAFPESGAGGKNGDEVSFTELPLAGLTEALSDEDGEETLEITRDGDTYRVAMTLDLSDAAGEDAVEEMDPAALGMREPEGRVSITLPGRIVEANGETTSTP